MGIISPKVVVSLKKGSGHEPAELPPFF